MPREERKEGGRWPELKRGRQITDMELKVLLTEAHREDSLSAAWCDLKTGKEMASSL